MAEGILSHLPQEADFSAKSVTVLVFYLAVMVYVEMTPMLETILFTLYLVLAEKPRIDDSNAVQYSLQAEECDIMAKNLNENYELLWPDKNHSMLYICKEQVKEDKT